jgi:hypothetical protein
MSKLEVDAIEPQSGTSLTLGASGDTITIPSGATLSSTDPLVFPAGTVSLPAITTTGDTNTGIFFPAADTIAFTEGGAEAMRIDSSGNVLINTTDASTLTAGIKLRASDNAIAAVVKDSTTVGSIGVVNSNNLFIQGDSTNSGLQCGTNTILPVQNGANASNTIDMGDGSNLWKDLYLGGGLYVGGTGSANKLDDYEEGTWTPTVIGTTVAGTATYTTQLGRYTKIGNIVNLYFAVNWSSGTGTGNLRISGLPFSAINGTNSSYFPTGMLAGNSLTFSVNTPYISVVNNSALIDVGQMSSGATNVKVAYDSSANINGSITYETN